MTRFVLAGFALVAVGLCLAAEPAPTKGGTAPVELALLGEDKLARVELRVEVDGVNVATIWDETFAKLFAYFDRNGDGALDAKEAALLPSARSLRQAMGNGFAPPTGAAPAFADLDRNGDGKVTADELAAHYRAAGLGRVPIGAGRLPASAELTAALLKNLDTDGDGKVSEKEWTAAADVLKKLDKNDDELVGAGELVPKTVYPGAAGTVLLAPPAADVVPPDVLAKLPLVVLPADPKDVYWATEVAKRNPRFKGAELPNWRKQEPDARWVVKLSDKPGAAGRFAFAGSRVRVDGWVAGGTVNEALSSARKQLIGQLDAPPEPTEAKGNGRRGSNLAWLVPIADRNGDGTLERKELDAWFDLQVQIARGQVLLTVLDGAGVFELLDTNHDGALSVRELRHGWQRIKEADCVTAGAFDPKKLPHVVLIAVSRGYPQALALDARRGPTWFRAMDRNGDGDVSRREFTGPADVFDTLDTDKDGLLSAEEAEKANVKK
ncbi:MAG TPA: EF-hand domain-containing protein [Gemmata sp.]